jgi:hypothetical protein
LNGAYQSVDLMQRLSGAAYDELLAKAVVFLDLIDASAVTTIVECMIRATPLVVNRIPPVIEYLGADYPLYFDTLGEAEAKLSDPAIMRAAHEHMLANPLVKQLTPQAFLNIFAETQVYNNVLLAAAGRID